MPHFTIEAEGGTIPLTPQTIYETLVQASAPAGNVQNVKAATSQLSNWESKPGYYSALQEVYANLSLDTHIRFQAIIQLKNGIDKHWRKTSVNPIGKDEKLSIRSKAVEAGIVEPSQPLALQNALMIAKIVRYEFPHDWPDVISLLVSHLRKANETDIQPAYVANIMGIALQIVKELSAARLQRTKKSLQSVSSELLHVLSDIYVTNTELWMQHGGSNHPQENAVTTSYNALKTIRRLIVAIDNPNRVMEVERIWTIFVQHSTQLWTGLEQGISSEYIPRFLLQIAKLHLEVARNHPAAFMLLPGSLQILTRSWSTITQYGNSAHSREGSWNVRREGDRDEDQSLFEKLTLRAMLLLRACVKMVFSPQQTFKYQQPQDKIERKDAVSTVKEQVLTDEIVVGMMETLVTQYFVLRPADLRDWQEEPDEWEKREEEITEAWEFSLRSCAEKLFLDLIVNFRDLLVPRLLQVFGQYSALSNTDVFLKDSLYSAVGIAAASLHEKLDFDNFLQNTLAAEVLTVRPHYNLLRRRTAILLGQWVPIQPESLNRMVVYQIYAHLLSKADSLNDPVVRVTAGRHLRLTLEPFEFNFADFQPHAASILEGLMTLIQETELSETKLALLETARVAVSRLEGHIEPYADAIMSLLPNLWADSGEEHLMKQAILTMISAIITALNEKSTKYHTAVLPLIRDSVSPDSETLVYLLEDALDLWAAVLQQTPTSAASPELIFLSHCLVPLFEMGSDSLRQTFELTESYILLSPTAILIPTMLDPLLAAALSLVGATRVREASLGPHVLDILVQALALPNQPVDLVQNGLRHLLASMTSTGYFLKILAGLKEAHAYHQDPRANHRPPDIVGLAETSLFTIIARLALGDPIMLLEAVGDNASWLFTEWLAHFDSIGDPQCKKLHTLAITFLLAVSPAAFRKDIQGLMTVWTDVITELGDEAPEETQGDYLWTGYRTVEEPRVEMTPEEERRNNLTNVDPTYTMNIRAVVAGRLGAVVQSVGGPETFQREWLSALDSEVVQAFASLKLL